MQSHQILTRLIAVSLLGFASAKIARADAPGDLERYDVAWESPSHDASGSMPIGNGEVGLNLWVEEDGDLRFLIGRTDAWSEASRLLKLGRIRLALSPNPFAKGAPFRQVLRLRDGRIEIVAGPLKLKVYVDANAPVIHLVGKSERPLTVTASLECWRAEKRRLSGDELPSSWTMQAAPEEVEVWESADTIAEGAGSSITWYHRNEHSCVPLTLKHQGLAEFSGFVSDPILHRTFGGKLTAPGFSRKSRETLVSPGPIGEFVIRVITHSAVTPSVASWGGELDRLGKLSADAAAVERGTGAWWNGFWDRSWIFVEGDKADVEGPPTNAHPLRIGADSNGASQFRGAMGRATLFARALGDAEIGRLAAGGPGDAPAIGDGRLIGGRLNAAPDGMRVVGAVRFEELDGTRVARFEGGHLATAPGWGATFPASFTLEAWVRPDPGSRGSRIFDKLTAGKGDGFLFDTHPGLSLRLIVGSQSLATGEAIRPGEWNHVAAVYDALSSGRRIYVNGKILKAEGGGGMEQPTPSPVTRAYVLQRWIAACGGRGNFPTKFNGSIFTVDPEFAGGEKTRFNPDWRRWGDCYWWQNTRLPAWSAVASGDFDLCAPIFRLYRDVLPICKARARLYYGAEGVYFPETMTSFGTYANRDYGWDRAGKKVGDVDCKYWRWAWQQGLELVQLMLDCHERTLDERFLAEDVVPMAREVLRYFDTRFPRDARGKLIISPTQAVETYWTDVVNDTPTVAGLIAVLDRLLALPDGGVPAAERELWRRMRGVAPALPTRVENGASSVLPAERFDPKRSNCENPELYAIWPFRLLAAGRDGIETGIETFHRRGAKIMTGWCYDGQCAALLGMTDEARRQILHKVRNSHRNFRFPAMWGPNFDWIPDQDHGSNILLTLQQMILNADGDRIVLLPAWPREWTLDFKLHAPRRTTVEGKVRQGKLVDLRVTPPERRKDVVFAGGWRGGES